MWSSFRHSYFIIYLFIYLLIRNKGSILSKNTEESRISNAFANFKDSEGRKHDSKVSATANTVLGGGGQKSLSWIKLSVSPSVWTQAPAHGGIMAQNETDTFLEILKSFNLDDMILAFCLSVLVGLLLGALIYLLLTWASRRRATARITRRSKKKSGASQTNDPTSSQLGLYRSTFLSVYRQPSLEPVGPLGSKPGAETSTFRPLPKKSRPGLDMGDDTQVSEDATPSNSSDSASLVSSKRHSFWLGSNGLKGFLPSQMPPPAYDTIIHAFDETCT